VLPLAHLVLRCVSPWLGSWLAEKLWRPNGIPPVLFFERFADFRALGRLRGTQAFVRAPNWTL